MLFGLSFSIAGAHDTLKRIDQLTPKFAYDYIFVFMRWQEGHKGQAFLVLPRQQFEIQ